MERTFPGNEINIQKLISNLEEFGYKDEGIELVNEFVTGCISKEDNKYFFRLGTTVTSSEIVVKEISSYKALKLGKTRDDGKSDSLKEIGTSDNADMTEDSELKTEQHTILEVGDWNGLHFYIAEIIE